MHKALYPSDYIDILYMLRKEGVSIEYGVNDHYDDSKAALQLEKEG